MPVADPPREEAVHLVPLDEIDTDSLLLRDRIAEDSAAREELVNSILRSGLRMPVELFALVAPEAPRAFGLVSGFRRLDAFRRLKERSGSDIWDRIPAFIRRPDSERDILRRIVEENDVRRDVSPWEKARVAVNAAERGWFGSAEEAVSELFASASPMKRSRIRAATRAVALLEGLLAEPWRLTERQCARIAAAAERDRYGDAMQTALEESDERSIEGQWRLLEPLILEAERPLDPAGPPPTEGRPRLVLRPHRSLVVRRERRPEGWSLHFTGAMAREGMIEDVLDDIELKFARSA